jgi:Ca2+-binding RTX toxin-like protein
MAKVLGTVKKDILFGTSANDQIFGLDDADTLVASDGNDTLDGDTGTDTVSYAAMAGPVSLVLGSGTSDGLAQKFSLTTATLIDGSTVTISLLTSTDTLRSIENVVGTKYDDSITGNDLPNVIAGLGGADTIDGRGGSDTVDYSASASGIRVNLGRNGFNHGGDAEGDTLFSIENVIGSNSKDTIIGNDQANKLEGKGDDDRLIGQGGGDYLDGGDGKDTADYFASPAAVYVNLSTHIGQNGDAAGDHLYNIEKINGSNFADVLTGDAGDNVLWGNGDDDFLIGLGGADQLLGGDGRDRVIYEASPEGVTINLLTNSASGGDATGDQFISIEDVTGSDFADSLTGDFFDNRLDGLGDDDILAGLGGADQLYGGDGKDTVDYSLSSHGILLGVTVDLGAGRGYNYDAEGDTYFSIENVIGSEASDLLIGNGDDNVLDGHGGGDHFGGSAGADTFIGSDDIGADIADYSLSPWGVTVNLQTNVNYGGDAEGDKLINIEWVYGSKNPDTITGDGKDNSLLGLDGDDTLNGGEGNDVLSGGADNDTLYGGLGRDDSNGMDGADTFVYTSVKESFYAFDTSNAALGPQRLYDGIFNFEHGIDKLDLTKIDANTSVVGDQAFHVVASFTHHAGELTISAPTFEDYGTYGTLYQSTLLGDVDGDGTADLAIDFTGYLHNNVLIAASDILL